MTKKAMVQRAIQCISGLTLPKIRTSPDLLSKDDNESRDYAMQVLLDIGQRLTFVEAPVTSNRIKSTVISTGAKICVIDYLQRMMPDVIEEGSNKTAHMDHCLGGLLQLSQQQDCSVIMISSTPKRIDPKTRIMDCFRDTGGAAFDADIIYFGENNEDSKSAEVAGCKTVTWHCEKHREGITHISANFDGSVMRYVDGITYE